jgi:hypothetical protein
MAPILVSHLNFLSDAGWIVIGFRDIAVPIS